MSQKTKLKLTKNGLRKDGSTQKIFGPCCEGANPVMNPRRRKYVCAGTRHHATPIFGAKLNQAEDRMRLREF